LSEESKMKKGEVVTIHEDPITEEKPEGEAKLLKKIDEDHHAVRPRCEFWQVKFLDEKYKRLRFIKKIKDGG